MKIGVMIGASGPDAYLSGLIDNAKALEERGFSSIWMANIFGFDAMTTLALVGQQTSRIELGTAVVPTYPRHPLAIAQQAWTVGIASGGRFVLGIGLSHKLVIESMMGLSYDKPARHMREYMSVLAPLLRGEPTKFEGETYRVQGALEFSEGEPVPVLIAAMGDQMLKLAGKVASGTVLWMTGPATVENHILPKLTASAAEAGRPAPRVVAGLPIILTNQPDEARERIAKALTIYGQLPSYRAMLDKEGMAGPADIALVGEEKELDAGLDRLRDSGVTDFGASIMPVEDGAQERTLDYLQSRL